MFAQADVRSLGPQLTQKSGLSILYFCACQMYEISFLISAWIVIS